MSTICQMSPKIWFIVLIKITHFVQTCTEYLLPTSSENRCIFYHFVYVFFILCSASCLFLRSIVYIHSYMLFAFCTFCILFTLPDTECLIIRFIHIVQFHTLVYILYRIASNKRPTSSKRLLE